MQLFTIALAIESLAVSVSASITPLLRNVSPRATGVNSLSGSRGGKATFYGGNWQGGMCSFSDYPQGSFQGVAIGAQEWFGAASCGTCLRVTGPSGTQDVMVVDQCPECAAGHLDLFQNVANKVNVNAGRDGIFPITWQQVPCAVSGNIQLKNKEGTSAYYFAMQVRNSKVPIEKLEVSKDGGSSWTNIERFAYNFFTSYTGFGDMVDVRITASTGEVIVQKGVKISSGTIVQGQKQFA